MILFGDLKIELRGNDVVDITLTDGDITTEITRGFDKRELISLAHYLLGLSEAMED